MQEEIFKNIWWVLFLPILGFLVQSLAGKIVLDSLGPKVGKRLLGSLAVLPIAGAFFLAVQITQALWNATHGGHNEYSQILTLFEWITVGNLSVPFEVRVDALSMTMTLIITGIGALIHLYATGYMAEEKDYPRFFTYLNLFIAAMLLLVLGNNLVLLFVGWEGVGVCSYLLIGFWYKDLKNSFAANKAFIVNRIGDWGLTLALFFIITMVVNINLGDMALQADPRLLSYDVILPKAAEMAELYGPMMLAACVLLFVGAMGKSAQFPLYLWLPDAMAGPTPVSALIHAATMVTSGVFLLNRMSPFFEAAPYAGVVVAMTGAITALVGALIAFGQTDIKKVLAFSTVSQLGYMFIACGVGAYWVGLFHVATHAFFKALLFLGSGAVIHAMAHNQDMRNYGRLIKYIPITAATMLVGWLAIAGFPFLSGAFSKEEILIEAFKFKGAESGLPVGTIVGGVGLLVAVLTAAYMTRMTFMTFFSGESRWKLLPAHGHDDHHDHDHDHHGEHHAHDHGPDEHGFFYTDSELAAIEARTPHEHHHDLGPEHHPHEVPPSMYIPLVVLAIMSVIGGAWLFFGVHLADWLASAGVAVHPHKAYGPMEFVKHALENWIFWASVGAFVLGVGWGYSRYFKKLPENDGVDLEKWPAFMKASSRQFGIDSALTDGWIRIGAFFGKVATFLDKWLIDGIVNLVGLIAKGFGNLLKGLQTGYVRSYAVLMQLGIFALVVYIFYVYILQGGAQ
ncbi:NADH-quinone oxidoreductase subunit L [Kamptonema cortianum]|nr:NADH-quinone oxidoreductase subunit L [Geitlerinema splendidum]MDK3162510.1 NADH-quinone oxidoreductase subunit L [Kamptonema cortianum]